MGAPISFTRCFVPEAPTCFTCSVVASATTGAITSRCTSYSICRDRAGALLQSNAESGSRLRHPVLERPYFWGSTNQGCDSSNLHEGIKLRWFFIGADHPSFPRVTAYLQCLIDNARGTPVLECCRSFGRAVALHRVFAERIFTFGAIRGTNASPTIDYYFETTLHLILQATDLPPVLQSIKNKYGSPISTATSLTKKLPMRWIVV